MICDKLAAGETLRAMCREEGMPLPQTVCGWVVQNVDGFAERYARARELGWDRMAEETIEIADDATSDTVTDAQGQDRPNTEWISRSKLRVDTRKWLLSKLAHKQYGDRLSVDATVDVTAGSAMAEARKRTAGE